MIGRTFAFIIAIPRHFNLVFLSPLSSLIVFMLKLKFLFALFLMQNTLFAWGQQTQLTPLTSPVLPSAPVNISETSKVSTKNVELAPTSNSRNAGEVNVSGLVCSIFTSNFDWLTLSFVLSFHTTYKVEPSCDEDYFYQVTMASMEAQSRIPSRSSRTFRVGAHTYTMDVNLSPVDKDFFYIGRLRFSTTGEIRISLFDAIKQKTGNVATLVNSPYKAYAFQSKIHYIWNIGTLIHRLVAPNGDAYIMYEFTNEVSTGLTRDSLINLKELLNLPPGWMYQNVLTSETITVRAAPVNDYYSDVLYDELNNFYVKYK